MSHRGQSLSERLANDVDDARGWSLVESLGPQLCTMRLAIALDALSTIELGAFCRWLDQVTSRLDTPAHRDRASGAYEFAYSATTEPAWTPRTHGCPVDPDELRATVVACGRDAWRAGVAHPELLAGAWPTALGRAFLLTVAQACRRAAVPAPLGTGKVRSGELTGSSAAR